MTKKNFGCILAINRSFLLLPCQKLKNQKKFKKKVVKFFFSLLSFSKKINKVREMQNSSEVFKSNFDYYQRVAHKKLSKKNVLLDFPTSRFPAGGPFSDIRCYSRFSLVELTKIWISLKRQKQTEFCKKI